MSVRGGGGGGGGRKFLPRDSIIFFPVINVFVLIIFWLASGYCPHMRRSRIFPDYGWWWLGTGVTGY